MLGLWVRFRVRVIDYPRYIFIVGHINLLSNYEYFLPRVSYRLRARPRVRVRVSVMARVRRWLCNRSPIGSV